MSDEPEYLQRLRRTREEREQKTRAGQGPAAAQPEYSRTEHEALRWAREVGRAEPKSVRSLAGARYALLIQYAGASGNATHALEGYPTKDALVQRIKSAVTMSEELAGAYEINSGRPLAIGMEAGEPSLKPGQARAGVQRADPAKMLRDAERMAAERAKSRPARDRDDRRR